MGINREIFDFWATGEGHYKAGQFGAYKAGQVGAYKATHPQIWGARVTPIRPLLSICDKIVNLWEKGQFFRKNLKFQKP